MTAKINHMLELHPSLGWLASLVSILLGWLTWLLEHAGEIAQFFGLVAGIFGMIAGYYTMRIQRRTWLSRKRKHDETLS